MHFDLDGEQHDLSRALRGELDRLLATGAELTASAVHPVLADLGLPGLELPPAAGGLGLPLRHGVVVCEVLGSFAASDGYRATALLGDILADPQSAADGRDGGIPAGGDALTSDDLMAAAAAGKVTVVAGYAGAPVTRTRGGLSGSCLLDRAPDGSVVVVPAREGLAVLADTRGWIATRPRPTGCELVLERAPVLAWLPGSDAAPIRGHVRQAAYLWGLASAANQMAVRRASTRRQFGRAIGDHQAVAFPLARQYSQLEALRLLVHEAAWRVDGNHGAAEVAAVEALAYAGELALEVTAGAVHVHGALGLTRLAPVHRHYHLAATEATRWGSPALLWRAAARAHRACPAT